MTTNKPDPLSSRSLLARSGLYRAHLREQDASLEDAALEEQVEEAWLDWYFNASGHCRADIDSIVDDWLSGEPDWANEWEHVYKTGNAQGAAYDHFLREDRGMLDESPRFPWRPVGLSQAMTAA